MPGGLGFTEVLLQNVNTKSEVETENVGPVGATRHTTPRSWRKKRRLQFRIYGRVRCERVEDDTIIKLALKRDAPPGAVTAGAGR